jgi:3-deoxy-manno-octulosonate cytidylyltransferase (CMP-KDO synthetase)
MATIAILPARYASSRLPGKALLDRTGKPLVRHAVESIAAARRIERVVVATDDERIARAVEDFGGRAVMTSAACRTGSDRLAEAADALGLDDDDIVVNVQADEPEMPPACVDRSVELLCERPDAHVATLASRISAQQAEIPSYTKVVFGVDGTAMYFSRAKIPADRDGTGEARYFLHHGIYAYRAGFLRAFAALETSQAEYSEKLEQLRALENGFKIVVSVVDYHGARIDTPEEYERFVREHGSQR